MLTVICLGPKACDLGEVFENSKEYNIKLIDKDIEGDNCFSLKRQKTPEEYESKTPDMSEFFSDISEEVLFVTSGDAEVLSSALRILQQIKDKKISIVYIRPTVDFLTSKGQLQDKLAFNVFQQYARSGVFEKIFLFDDNSIETLMSDTSINEFDNKYYNLIFNSLTNYIKLDVVDALIDNSYQPNDISRIISFGYYDINSDIENMFYPIKHSDNKIYNFYINEETLENDKTLHKKIKEKIKNKNVENTKCSYTIRGTKTEQSFCYVVAYSKFIQQ
jgi:hypothetical protein